MSLMRQSAFLFADRLVFAASIFLTGVLVARCYGTEGFGLYVVASAVLQTLVGTIASATEVPFSRSWLSVRGPAERSRVHRDFVRALAIAGLLAAVCLSGAGWLAAKPHRLAAMSDAMSAPAGLSVMLLAGMVSLLQLPLMPGEWRLRGVGAAASIARTRVPFILVGFTVKLMAAISGVPLWALFALIGLESVVLGALLTRSADRLSVGSALSAAPASEIASATLESEALSGALSPAAGHPSRFPEALRLGLASLAVVAFFRLNPLIVAAVSSVEEAARYGSAMALIFAFDLVTSSITSAAFPQLVRRRMTPGECLPEFQKLGRIYALLSLGYIAFVAMFGQALLGAVYGDAFVSSYPVLLILACATPFTSSAALRGLYINLAGRSELHLANGLIALAVLAPLSVVWSASHGATGAALAMALACAASGVAASFVFPSTRAIGLVQIRSFIPRALRHWSA
jgi:O-antigen/teichoic acid export membrane protein